MHNSSFKKGFYLQYFGPLGGLSKISEVCFTRLVAGPNPSLFIILQVSPMDLVPKMMDIGRSYTYSKRVQSLITPMVLVIINSSEIETIYFDSDYSTIFVLYQNIVLYISTESQCSCLT